MSEFEEYEANIALRRQCGICGCMLRVGEEYVALIGNVDSTAFGFCSDVSTVPDHVYVHVSTLSALIQPRRRLNSSAGGYVSPEAASVHYDCFQLFRRECTSAEALDLLWIVAAWRNPWREAPDLHLYNYEPAITPLVLEAAEGLAIPLRLLPTEIVEIIRSHSSRHSLFWRYGSAQSLAEELSRTVPTTTVESLPLCELLSWERGGPPVLTTASDCPPVVRLTIDSRGIKRAESIPKDTAQSHNRSDNMLFITQDRSQLRRISVSFMHGVLRLQVPEQMNGLQIWDIPRPPLLEDCHLWSGRTDQFTQFRTIDIQKTTGITLFLANGRAFAIHSHTVTMPCAKTTFERLFTSQQQRVAWAYIPIPAGDQIIAVGVPSQRAINKSGSCIMIRTKLAGEVTVGLYDPAHAHDYCSRFPATLLLYAVTRVSPIYVLGVYSNKASLPEPQPPWLPLITRPPSWKASFSSAPLEKVTRAQVFSCPETGFSRAILFDYENGAQRAVGDCRIGVDPFVTYMKPSRICFLAKNYPQAENGSDSAPRTSETESGHVQDEELVMIASGSESESEHSHEEDGWACHGMRGDLHFWFKKDKFKLEVIERE